MIQAESNLYMSSDTMADVLYGDEFTQIAPLSDGSYMQRDGRSENGLFDGKAYSTINGVILVPQKATPLDDRLTGLYHANPQHFNHVEHHPKPFSEVPFLILNQWKGGEQWHPLLFGDSQD
jgi:hypothetical protein